MNKRRQLTAVVMKEFTLLIRDLHALAILFVMPSIFIFLLSIALKDVFAEKGGTKITIELVNQDGDSAFAKDFSERVRKLGQFVIVGKITSKAKARITIPAGAGVEFERMFETPGAKATEWASRLILSTDPTLDSSYRWFIRSSLINVWYELVLHRYEKALTAALPPDQTSKTNLASERTMSQFLIEDSLAGTTATIPTPLQQNVPGWSLFAMFFIAVPLASSVLRERQDGTIKRLLTLPVNKSILMVGKLVPYAFVNILQFGLMLLVGLYLVPLCSDLTFQLGQSWLNLLIVTIVSAVAATSFGIFISCVSRSIEQASALAAGVVISMAAVGGIMVPVFAMPDFMQTLAQISPLYWGHQAYLDVLVRETSLSEIAPKLLILAVFSMAALSIAKVRFRWL